MVLKEKTINRINIARAIVGVIVLTIFVSYLIENKIPIWIPEILGSVGGLVFLLIIFFGLRQIKRRILRKKVS